MNEGNTSTLDLLCKGAGVDIEDARWRVAAGLDPKQAVDAAAAQKQANETATSSPAQEVATKKKGDK